MTPASWGRRPRISPTLVRATGPRRVLTSLTHKSEVRFRGQGGRKADISRTSEFDPNRTIEGPTPTVQFRTIQVCLKDLNRPAVTLSVEKSARKGSVACGMQQACPQLRDLTYRALSRRAKFDEM